MNELWQILTFIWTLPYKLYGVNDIDCRDLAGRQRSKTLKALGRTKSMAASTFEDDLLVISYRL